MNICYVYDYIKLNTNYSNLNMLFSIIPGAFCEMEIDLASVNPLFEGVNYQIYDECTKNKGHVNFVRLPELTLSHIPGCRHQGFVRYIRWRAAHTVKLTVCHTSGARTDEYACPNICRNGTGFINRHRLTSRASATSSSTSTSVKATESDLDLYLQIKTAAHVVYDEAEVKSTLVELFFDDDKDRSGVIFAKGVKLLSISKQNDRCQFTAHLVRPEKAEHVAEKLRRSWPNDQFEHSERNVTFTISHPHGVAKRITFGSIESVNQVSSLSDEVIDNLAEMSSQAKQDLDITERKFLLYFSYFKIYVNTTEPTYFGTPDRQRREIVKHLYLRNMVELPSRPELESLHQVFGPVLGIDDNCFKNMCFDVKQVQETLEDDNEIKYDIIDDGIKCFTVDDTEKPQVKDNGNDKDADRTPEFKDGFRARFKELHRECQYKLREVWYSKSDANAFLDNIKVNYHLDTCPGSSGSLVEAYIVENTVPPVKYLVSHSKGRRGDSGISGGGLSFLA